MSERDADVVVVGAGLAGLVAARDARAGGASVVVLEARDRVGGRTLNEPLGDGKVVEVGGQWIGPSQHRMAALARSVGVGTFATHTEGDHLLEYGGKVRRYSGAMPRISPAVTLDYARVQRKLDQLARTVPLEAPWQTPGAAELDSQTVWSWIRRHARTAGARSLLDISVEGVFAADAGDLSLLHVLFYVHSAGGFDALVSTGGGAQQDRFEGGSQLVSERLAEPLRDALALSAPVRRVEHGAHGVRVQAEGVAVRARRAILAIPPPLAGRIAYHPSLPAQRDQLTQRMPQGSVIKCMAVYDRPFWRDNGLSGQASSDVGPVKVIFDNSPPDGSPGVLLGFLEGGRARELGALPEAQRREAVVGCFARMFGGGAATPERYIERVWADEEWTRGCYGCYFPTGGWTSYGPALRAPIGPLHWAGAETGTHWMGYMEGAVESGERAAGEALAAL